MAKRLYIDMLKCDECKECTVKCDYLYQPEVTDHGILALREQVAFMLVCRRCEEPSCVAACKFDALERQENGILERYNMRCVSCKCCSHACPFGTIYPETVPYMSTKCDFCLEWPDGREPSCISNCVKNAIEYREIEELQKDDIHLLGDHLAVHSTKWAKKDVEE